MFPEYRSSSKDALAERLLLISQNVLAVIFGLLPIAFIPSSSIPFGYTKILFVIVGIFITLILYSFSILRTGNVRGNASWPILVMWFVTFGAVVSALFSGDFRDAFIGNAFEVHTALFVALMALVASVWMLVGVSKAAVMRLYIVLSVSTIVLSLFHVSRLVLGADFLSLGLFENATVSPLGSWNDLGIFFGLSIILALIALEQLPLKPWGKWLFAGVVVAALAMLAAINFFAVWVILGLVSLIVLVYAVSKDRFSADPGQKLTISGFSLGVTLLVLATSTVFIVGGSAVGGAIGRATDISYIEVRPSFQATTDIVKEVYKNEAIFGIGPNKFIDAWRLHKDPTLNATIFWNTDFTSGIGYIPTFFATTGIVGGLLWFAFLVTFAVFGIRTLVRTTNDDKIWYFVGTSAFAAGLYLWGMTIVYVPGPVLLLLAAMCTGLVASAHYQLTSDKVKEFGLGKNRYSGFMVVAVVMLLIVGSISSLYFVGRHYTAVYTFNKSEVLAQPGISLDDVEAEVVRAFDLSGDDRFARRLAEYQLARIGALISVQNPTAEQQTQFSNALNNGINAAQIATEKDGSDARNWVVLGNVYASLVAAQVEGAYERAEEAIRRAQVLDPRNPSYMLMLAQIASANNNLEKAKEFVTQAIALKNNYSAAIFFLSQIDIALGNIEAAMNAARAVTVLEPQNPVRFFQLGILELNQDLTAQAILSLERAVALDPNYANARYFLALAYDSAGRSNDARIQLEEVQKTNPGNAELTALLERLNKGEKLIQPTSSDSGNQPVVEAEGVLQDGEAVTTKSAPDTPLISPVNTEGATVADPVVVELEDDFTEEFAE